MHLDKLNTRENLHHKGIIDSRFCPRCPLQIEDKMHLFFDCPVAQHIWKRTGTHPLHSGLVNIWKMSPSGSAVRGVPSPESEVRQIRPVVEAQGADAVDHGVRVDGARWRLSGVEDR
jgi:hypothetical protein